MSFAIPFSTYMTKHKVTPKTTSVLLLSYMLQTSLHICEIVQCHTRSLATATLPARSVCPVIFGAQKQVDIGMSETTYNAEIIQKAHP